MPWVNGVADGAAIWFSIDPILSSMRKPRAGMPLKCVTTLASGLDSSKQEVNSMKSFWGLKSFPDGPKHY